jgi:hypothetical protein
MDHPPSSTGSTLNDFFLFPKIKYALKGRRFQDIEDIKKCDNGTESYYKTGVPKMFPTVAGSIVGLSALLLKGSTCKVICLSMLQHRGMLVINHSGNVIATPHMY